MPVHVERASQEDLPAIWEVDPIASTPPERRKWLMDAVEQRACLVAKSGWAVKGFLVQEANFFGYPLMVEMATATQDDPEVMPALLAYVEKTTQQDQLFVAVDKTNTQVADLLASLGYVACGEVGFVGENGDGKMFFVKKLS